jgi:hypothetical protein
MGSILEETNELTFDIKVEDEDSAEKISSIQIIGDGGKIVKEITNVKFKF